MARSRRPGRKRQTLGDASHDPATRLAVGTPDLGAGYPSAHTAAERQWQHRAEQPVLPSKGGRLDQPQFLPFQPQQPQRSLVAVDDEQLADADLTVERHLLLGVVAGALDLNEEVGTTAEVGVAIDRPAVFQDHEKVGDAMVVFHPFRRSLTLAPG